MIHCAKIVNNVVVDLIVVGDPTGIEWCRNNLPGFWVETSPDGLTNGKFACIGDIYDSVNNTFSSPNRDLEESIEEIL